MGDTSDRDNRREEYETEIECIHPDSGQVISAVLKNYSSGGMYFEAPQAFAPGTILTINMKNIRPDSKTPDGWRNYRVEVRWSRRIEDAAEERFGIGIQYVENYDHFPGFLIH